MAFEDAIVALQQNWDDVMARLEADDRDQLAGLLAALEGPEFPRVAARLSDFFMASLPCDHPVRRELETGRLFTLATLDWPAVFRHLRRLAAAGAPRLADQPGGRQAHLWDIDGAGAPSLGH